MKKSIFAIAILAVTAVGAHAQEFKKFIGKPAPAFKLTTTDGKVLTNASLKGKAVLVDLWATWCGPCKAASPSMDKLHKTYGAKGLTVIGAIVMDADTLDANKKLAANYKKEHKYSYTFAAGGDPFATALGVRGIPTFVFIDKKGNIADVLVGFGGDASMKQFETVVKGLLK